MAMLLSEIPLQSVPTGPLAEMFRVVWGGHPVVWAG